MVVDYIIIEMNKENINPDKWEDGFYKIVSEYKK